MATLEQRVGRLEGRQQTFENDVRAGFVQVNNRLNAVEARLTVIEGKLDLLATQVGNIVTTYRRIQEAQGEMSERLVGIERVNAQILETLGHMNDRLGGLERK